MALEANFHLAFRAQPGRVNDRRADHLLRSSLRRSVDVLLSGPVAALAVDALRQRRHIGSLGYVLVLALRDLWIAVVAEHALVINGAHRTRVVRTIVARIHRPV